MAERTPSNPSPDDPGEGFEFDRKETRQGFERDKEDVVPESEATAEELYSGELSGEIVDPELLRNRQRDQKGMGTDSNS